ncbi:SIR2 family protein [Cardiobacterium hominis]|nr:SIR2 family protein [Cardiobacterium hominis]
MLRNFLLLLKKEFDIGIVTLNYDNIFTQSLPELYTGFNAEGTFDSISTFRRKQWNFIYHLHGSIHFSMTGNKHDMHAINWRKEPKKDNSVHVRGRNDQDSLEKNYFPTFTIIAGYGKTQQILRQPFRTYFAQANRLAHEADAFLFLGYGFSDLHLNSIFSEIRDDGKQRKIVVVDYADDKQDSLAFRCDNWSYHLCKTLVCGKDVMDLPPVTIKELRINKELEASKNPDYPLAIWYFGMLEACRYPDKILEHLL